MYEICENREKDQKVIKCLLSLAADRQKVDLMAVFTLSSVSYLTKVVEISLCYVLIIFELVLGFICVYFYAIMEK